MMKGTKTEKIEANIEGKGELQKVVRDVLEHAEEHGEGFTQHYKIRKELSITVEGKRMNEVKQQDTVEKKKNTKGFCKCFGKE